MMTLNNVLVPVDFNPSSEAALSQARAMADAWPHATLHFLHVVTEPLHEVWTAYAPGVDFIGRIHELEAAARSRLEAMRTIKERKESRAVIATSWGEPAEEILRYAWAPRDRSDRLRHAPAEGLGAFPDGQHVGARRPVCAVPGRDRISQRA